MRENTGTTYGFRQSRLDLRREVAVVSVALRNDDIAVGTARESPRKIGGATNRDSYKCVICEADSLPAAAFIDAASEATRAEKLR